MTNSTAEFETIRARSDGWRTPPSTGRHLPMWRHLIADHSDGRVTISAGSYRVGIRCPATYFVLYGWHDPPGLAADLELRISPGAHAPRATARLTAWSPDGFELAGAWVDGAVSTSEHDADFTLRQGPKLDLVCARKGVMEAAVAALLSLVLRAGGLLLHAATFVIDGHAVVVVGASGRGKTTICQRLPDQFLNEEFAFITPTGPDGAWQSHWYAQERSTKYERPAVLPLGGIFLLSEARQQTRRWPASTAESIQILHEASLWIPGIPPSIQLDAHNSLLLRHRPCWLSHHLASSTESLLDVLRSLTS